MGYVPNTDNFSLQDVVDNVPVTTVASSLIDSFSNPGGGELRCLTTNTRTLATGVSVTISSSTWYNGTYTILEVGLNSWFTVTKNYTFGASGTWTSAVAVPISLAKAFIDADDDKFHPTYKGSKDRLSNFRDYGYSGTLAYVDTESSNVFHMASNQNTSYFIAAIGRQGVKAFSVTTSGVISIPLISTYDDGEYFIRSVYMLSESYIFSFGVEYDFGSPYSRFYLLGISAGIMSRIDYIEWNDLEPVQSNTNAVITSDENKFVFLAVINYLYQFFIKTIQYTSTTIVEKTELRFGTECTAILYQNGYLFIAEKAYALASHSVNQTTGVISFVNKAVESNEILSIDGNGDDLIFITTGYDIKVYSVNSSGTLFLEDTYNINDIPVNNAGLYFGNISYCRSTKFLYADNNGSINVLRIDSNNDIVFMSNLNIGSTYNYDILVHPNSPNVALASPDLDIKSYLLS